MGFRSSYASRTLRLTAGAWVTIAQEPDSPRIRDEMGPKYLSSATVVNSDQSMTRRSARPRAGAPSWIQSCAYQDGRANQKSHDLGSERQKRPSTRPALMRKIANSKAPMLLLAGRVTGRAQETQETQETSRAFAFANHRRPAPDIRRRLFTRARTRARAWKPRNTKSGPSLRHRLNSRLKTRLGIGRSCSTERRGCIPTTGTCSAPAVPTSLGNVGQRLQALRVQRFSGTHNVEDGISFVHLTRRALSPCDTNDKLSASHLWQPTV